MTQAVLSNLVKTMLDKLDGWVATSQILWGPYEGDGWAQAAQRADRTKSNERAWGEFEAARAEVERSLGA